MNGAQITVIIVYAISLLIAAICHGNDRTDKHNWFITVTSTIIGCLILWWGGFWEIK